MPERPVSRMATPLGDASALFEDQIQQMQGMLPHSPHEAEPACHFGSAPDWSRFQKRKDDSVSVGHVAELAVRGE